MNPEIMTSTEVYETEKISLIHLTPFIDSVMISSTATTPTMATTAAMASTTFPIPPSSSSDTLLNDIKSLDGERLPHPTIQGPFCYLLEIDNAKILLDAGIRIGNDRLSVDHL